VVYRIGVKNRSNNMKLTWCMWLGHRPSKIPLIVVCCRTAYSYNFQSHKPYTNIFHSHFCRSSSTKTV